MDTIVNLFPTKRFTSLVTMVSFYEFKFSVELGFNKFDARAK